MPVEPGRWYSPATLSLVVGVSRRTVDNYRRRGLLAYRQVLPGGPVAILGRWWIDAMERATTETTQRKPATARSSTSRPTPAHYAPRRGAGAEAARRAMGR